MVRWSSADGGKMPEMVIEDVVKVISVMSADESESADGGHR